MDTRRLDAGRPYGHQREANQGGLAEGDASFVEGVGELAAFEEDGTLRFFDDGIEYQVRLAGDSDTSDAAPGVEVATALAKVMLTHA